MIVACSPVHKSLFDYIRTRAYTYTCIWTCFVFEGDQIPFLFLKRSVNNSLIMHTSSLNVYFVFFLFTLQSLTSKCLSTTPSFFCQARSLHCHILFFQSAANDICSMFTVSTNSGIARCIAVCFTAHLAKFFTIHWLPCLVSKLIVGSTY